MDEEMEKYATYRIQTDSLEKVLTEMFNMIQMVQLGRRCRVVLEYDPAEPDTSIETFVYASDEEKVKEKPFRWVPFEDMFPEQQERRRGGDNNG